VHNQVGAIERRCEEPLVASNLIHRDHVRGFASMPSADTMNSRASAGAPIPQSQGHAVESSGASSKRPAEHTGVRSGTVAIIGGLTCWDVHGRYDTFWLSQAPGWLPGGEHVSRCAERSRSKSWPRRPESRRRQCSTRPVM